MNLSFLDFCFLFIESVIQTHEDIFAAFGVIWKWFRQKCCETLLEGYKKARL